MAQQIPTSKNERDQLKAMLSEATHCMSRIEAEREQIKEILKAAEEKTGIKTKQLRKVATTMFKQNYADVRAEHDHFEFLYESLVEGRKTVADSNENEDDEDEEDEEDDQAA